MTTATNVQEPHKLAVAFRHWGQYVGRHYKRVLLVSSLVALLFAAGAAATFGMDGGDAAAMFTPEGNAGSAHRDRLHATFGNMDVMPTSFIISRHDGTNMATREEFNASLTLHRRLMAITIENQDATTKAAKPTITYADMCLALPTGDCLVNSVLRCFGFEEPPAGMAVTDPLCMDALGVPVFTRSTLGGDLGLVPLPAAPGFSLVGSAAALRYDYLAMAVTDGNALNNAKWESAATKVMAAYADEVAATHKVSYVSAQGVVEEGEALVSGDFLLFSVSSMAMVLMAVAFTFDPKQPVHCRGMVTYAGAMPVYFGVFAGLAVVGAAGIKFNPLMALTPVLFLANAIEIVFLLNRSFTRSHHRYLVHVRMSQTLSGAGPSIVGTQMAQAVVFTVAAIVSPFPAVTNMSIFTVVATVFQLLFQVTWYAAVLAWDGQREKDGRHAFMPWMKPKKGAVVPLRDDMDGSGTTDGVSQPRSGSSESEATEVVFAGDLEAGQGHAPAPPSGPPPTAAGSTEVEALPGPGPTQLGAGVKSDAARNADVPVVHVVPDEAAAMAAAVAAVSDTTLDSCDGVLEGAYGKMLMKTPAKGATMLVLFLVLVLAIVSITQMETGLDVRETLGADSRQAAFFDDQDAFYMELGLPVHVVVDSKVAYWDSTVRAALFHLTEGVRASEYVPTFPPVDSWFAEYKKYLTASSTALPTTEPEFISSLMGFLSQPATMRFRADLVLSNPTDGSIYPLTETTFAGGIEVTASRITVTTKPAYSPAAMSHQLNGMRDLIVAWGSPYLPSLYVTGQMFPVYEQQEAVVPFLVKVVLAAIFGGATCASSVMTRPALASMVQLTVITSCLGVLGALTPIVDLSLNIVTVVEIMFAAVLSTGYAMHITRAFGGDDMQGGRLSTMITLSRSTSSRNSRTEALRKAQDANKAAKRAAAKRAEAARKQEEERSQLSLMGFLRGFIGGEERQQRALFGLSAMGHPTLNAGGAVFVGLSCLAFASSYALRSLALVLLTVIPLGLLHTLAVLPVITSVVGPKSEAWLTGRRRSAPVGGQAA